MKLKPIFITFAFFLIIGVGAQFIGHYHEKKKPAFLNDWRLALIAPMFVFAELMFALGYRLDLQEELNKKIK